MGKPRGKLTVPDFSGQSQTMFYTDGARSGLLYTRRGRSESVKPVRMKSAIVALAWCQARRVCFVYLPADVKGN